MPNPRLPLTSRRAYAVIAIAGLSLLLLALASLALAWQRRLTASWERPVLLPAASADISAPQGRALWLIHPVSAQSLLPTEAPQAQSDDPWPALPAREALALLLAGVTPSSPEVATVTAAWPNQPAPPLALLDAATQAGRETIVALPLTLSTQLASSDHLRLLASETIELGALLHAALAADDTALLIVYVEGDAWSATRQEELAALAEKALAADWLVIASALPAAETTATGSAVAQHRLTMLPLAETSAWRAQDLAPTVAWWLGLPPLPLAEGRPLAELLSADPNDWASAEIAVAQQAQARATARLAPVNGLMPPQVGRDLEAAQAALAAGNWRGARQLARLARNAALAAERTQRATALGQQRWHRGLLALVVALLLLYCLHLLVSGRAWPTLHAGSVGAAVLGVWLVYASEAAAAMHLVGAGLTGPPLLAAGATMGVALISGLLIERRTAAELWYDMALAGLWLTWLVLLPIGWLFTLQGAWLTWQPPAPEQAALLHRLLGALGSTALAAALLPGLLTALLGLLQALEAALRRALETQGKGRYAHRHHR